MERINRNDLKDLMHTPHDLCISIYMPTYDRPARSQENRIAFKNIVNRTVTSLTRDRDVSEAKASALLEPAHELMDNITFWQKSQHGLCIFIAEGLFKIWHTPLHFEETVQIADHFLIKDILPLIYHNPQYYIMSLSQDQVAFYLATPDKIQKLDLKDMPRSRQEALRYHDREKHLQFHTRTADKGHERQAVFHGHGGESEDSKINLELFLQRVDDGISRSLKNTNIPLILAGEDNVCAAFKKVSHYPHLCSQNLSGYPDRYRPQELQAKTLDIFNQEKQNDTAKYKESFAVLKEREQGVSDIKATLTKAQEGVVDDLFVPEHRHLWGQWDRSRPVTTHDTPTPADVDLLNLAALHVLKHDGKVFVLPRDEMPLDTDVAAILRYSA